MGSVEGHFSVFVVVNLDKVFVSVYAITETNTSPEKSWIRGRGSSHCFVSSRTLLCRMGWKCHITLYTDCSLAVMVAGAMFELNSHFKHSKAQSSFIHINWIILPMAAPWPGSKGNIGM